MVSCVAYGCNNKSGVNNRSKKLSFFRFPGVKERERRQAWVNAVMRKKWTPTKYSFLCSEHFTANQIDLTYVSGPRLKPGSIPNVFDAHPDHLKPKKVVKRKSPAIQKILSSDESLNEELDPTPIANNVQDVEDSSTQQQMMSENLREEIVKLQNELRRKEAIKVKKDRVIRTLRQNIHRKEKTINDLTSLINELCKDSLLCDGLELSLRENARNFKKTFSQRTFTNMKKCV